MVLYLLKQRLGTICSGQTKRMMEADAFCMEGCLHSRDELGALVSHPIHIHRHKHCSCTCLRLLAAGYAVGFN